MVGLRVVIGNPLTTEADIDRVFADQTSIIDSGIVYKDFVEGSGLIPKVCYYIFQSIFSLYSV